MLSILEASTIKYLETAFLHDEYKMELLNESRCKASCFQKYGIFKSQWNNIGNFASFSYLSLDQ